MKAKAVRTALITGAGSGMGRAIAIKLACELGIEVTAADLSDRAARDTEEYIKDAGGKARSIAFDVSRSDQVSRAFETIVECKRLDLLVHAAGILGKTAFLDELDDGEWHQMIRVNLDGAFFCCREAIRWMKRCDSGRIILFSSIASMTPSPGAIHYAVSKAGINALARTLAKEVAPHNIRVNVIAPGYIKTPMLEGLPQGFEEHIAKKTPLKRLGDEGEVSSLVAYLISDDADFFTGQVISPNGGLVI